MSFLVNFPAGRTQLEDSVSTLTPLGAALLPYIAVAGVFGFGGCFAFWVLQRSVDAWTGGPDKRHFMRLHGRIERCKASLSVYDNNMFNLEPWDDNSFGSSFWSERYAEYIHLHEELQQLERDLKIIGIRTPEIDLYDYYKGANLHQHLVRLEVLARHGNVQSARELGCNQGR